MIIGREKEEAKLNELYHSGRAELVAVYGRRRVGKTFLVEQVFKDKMTFQHAGLSPIEIKEKSGVRPMRQQLEAFYYALLYHGMKKTHIPKSWLEAFIMLEMFLRDRDDGSRQVVFLDEIPWMDTKKSDFLTGLETFWNEWGCHRSNLMVIVCGSESSWMLSRLTKRDGGLRQALTCEMKLEPFTLKQCEKFLDSRNIRFSRYDIAQSYMIVGGIPYYLKYFDRCKSLAQNVNAMFFEEGANLRQEYDRLFSSIFRNPEQMKDIVEFLNQRSYGFTRKEIIEHTNAKDGGKLSENLHALIACNFVMSYVPFGRKKETHYKLIDPFCIFYLNFVKDRKELDNTFWQENASSQRISSWRGYAFENLCFCHIPQIKMALGVLNVGSEESAWVQHGGDGQPGTQIDMLIVRKDNVINMCEMKFYQRAFQATGKEDLQLRNRQAMLGEVIRKRKVIHNTLICTFGLVENEYSHIFQQVITLDKLFE